MPMWGWIVLGVAAGAVALVLVLSMCHVAGRSDEAMEKMAKKYGWERL